MPTANSGSVVGLWPTLTCKNRFTLVCALKPTTRVELKLLKPNSASFYLNNIVFGSISLKTLREFSLAPEQGLEIRLILNKIISAVVGFARRV
jgi:hypothetical protein